MKDEKTGDDLVSIGFVVDLEYADATTSAHDLLQQFKTHPLVKGSSRAGNASHGCEGASGGRILVDAETLDARSSARRRRRRMVDTVALKGVHHCIMSGKLAAESIYAALVRGESSLESYEQAIEDSAWAKSSTRCATRASRSSTGS